MPKHTPLKRKQKILNYTSEDCVNKLLNRGYHLDIELRNVLDALLVEKLRKDIPCHTRAFWEAQKETFPSNAFEMELCVSLCPLHVHNINYINLVIILSTFNIQQWKNFYRFCYLEWSRHFKDAPLWEYTPRSFASFDDSDVAPNGLHFLRHMVPEASTEHRTVRSLFLVNRLYQYMLPNV